jgi:hypothetical protein
VEPELTLRALSYGLVVLLAITLLALSLISLRKENRQGQPISGMIWFTVAIIGSCAVIVLLAGYAQKARSLEKVTHRVEAVPMGKHSGAKTGRELPHAAIAVRRAGGQEIHGR